MLDVQRSNPADFLCQKSKETTVGSETTALWDPRHQRSFDLTKSSSDQRQSHRAQPWPLGEKEALPKV